jgi:hypothetical protein
MALQTSSYAMTQLDNGKVHFVVKPAQLSNFFAGRVVWGVLGTMLLGGGAAFLGSPLGRIPAIGPYLLIGIIYAAAGFGFYKGFVLGKKWLFKMDGKERGTGGEFFISESGVEVVSGNSIPRDRIHRVTLRNKISKAEIPYAPGMVIGGSGMLGAGMAAGSVVGNAMSAALVTAVNAQNQKKAAVSYCVNIEHAGVVTELAGGMTETTAYGLMTDVGRALGMS